MSPDVRSDKWGNVMADFLKYPRTRHIVGSSLQKGDKDDFVSMEELDGKNLIIEEKIDGANVGISFDNDLNLRLQSRGHYLEGGDYPQFDQFKTWANTYQDYFFDILDTRYIMYGEWMSNFHTIYYDMLPHFFMEFDIYDTETDTFLSTHERIKLIDHEHLKIHQVLVLKEGICNSGQVDGKDISDYITYSHFVSRYGYDMDLKYQLETKLGHDLKEAQRLLSFNKSLLMEGLYIKWEEDGIVKERYKFVRPDFTQMIIDGGVHHLERPIIHNRLKDGCSLW